MIRLVKRITVGATILMPVLAGAHPGVPGHVHGFAAGVVHPLTGLDHLLAAVAVGFLAAQRGGRPGWMIPGTFLSFLAASAVIGMSVRIGVPVLEQALAASVLVFGILIASSIRLPLPAVTVLVGLFATCHGYAHGAEMPATASGAACVGGLVLATVVLLALGAAIGVLLRRAEWAPRLVGVVVAGAGVCLAFAS